MKNVKGITLIALVITIVVLIILAGVAISLSLGENGIFNKAKFATEEYANEQAREETEIAKLTNEVDKYVDSSTRTTSASNEYNVGDSISYDTHLLFSGIANSGGSALNFSIYLPKSISPEVEEVTLSNYSLSHIDCNGSRYANDKVSSVYVSDYDENMISIAITFKSNISSMQAAGAWFNSLTLSFN